jgi:hypothetical protein
MFVIRKSFRCIVWYVCVCKMSVCLKGSIFVGDEGVVVVARSLPSSSSSNTNLMRRHSHCTRNLLRGGGTVC